MIKRVLPRSLLGRSLLIVVMPLVLLQVVVTIIFYDRHWDTITRRLAGAVAGDVAMIVETMAQTNADQRADWIFPAARQAMNLEAVFIPGLRLENRPDWGRDTEDYDDLADALEERVGHPFVIDETAPGRDVQVRVQLAAGVLAVLVPRKRLFSTTTYIVVMWMVGTALLLIVIATLFMRNQVKPIRRLAAAADSFGKGREVPTFKPEGAAEVRQAAAAFNLMRERLQRYISQRTEMLAGVSHDLRTPLTRMRLQLAMMGHSPEIEELERDLGEMQRMIDGYLAFARGEGGEKPVPSDVTGLLEEVVALARKGGAAIDLHHEESLSALVRPEAFRRCLTNLIDNAVRHGAHVAVRAGRRGDAIELVVDDDGPGIPPEQREEVFKPFVRLDDSRNPETGGGGLGLTIARDVIRSHGGDVVLGESPTGGLRVRLWLPV
ncbi:MAG: HAMP domain-containing protein [Proteobacteria bacterium]|nr:HAMP domain-containing protein [Pseudomonadota bacterium]